jgi:uncharacterized protein (TIGR02246 family)
MALTGAAILVAAIFAPRSHGAAQDRDESEIRAVQSRQAEAWNRHDAKAYADLFAEDGDVVNVVGWWWKGRAEIESKLTAAFAEVFRESTLTITEVEVRFLDPGTAVTHVRWTMTGARTPPPIPAPRAGIQTQVPQHERGARDAVPGRRSCFASSELRLGGRLRLLLAGQGLGSRRRLRLPEVRIVGQELR